MDDAMLVTQEASSAIVKVSQQLNLVRAVHRDVCGHDEQKFEQVRGMYHPFFTLSYCYENIMYDYNSYTSAHNQSVVTTVIKEVVCHPSATEDNVKGMIMTLCNNPYLVIAVLEIKHN